MKQNGTELERQASGPLVLALPPFSGDQRNSSGPCKCLVAADGEITFEAGPSVQMPTVLTKVDTALGTMGETEWEGWSPQKNTAGVTVAEGTFPSHWLLLPHSTSSGESINARKMPKPHNPALAIIPTEI